MQWKNIASGVSVASLLLAALLAGYRGYSELGGRVADNELSVSLIESDTKYIGRQIDELRSDIRECVKSDKEIKRRVRVLENSLNRYRGQQEVKEND